MIPTALYLIRRQDHGFFVLLLEDFCGLSTRKSAADEGGKGKEPVKGARPRLTSGYAAKDSLGPSRAPRSDWPSLKSGRFNADQQRISKRERLYLGLDKGQVLNF